MKYRKQNRKKDYDYNWHGSYFITICTKNSRNYFGEIENIRFMPNQCGEIAKTCWDEIVEHFDYVELDAFVIMPNHIHGVINILWDSKFDDLSLVGDAHVRPLREIVNEQNRSQMRLSKVIQQYKAAVTKNIRLKHNKSFQWQRSFYDRIIRNEKELQNIRNYIETNPVNYDLSEDPVRVFEKINQMKT